MRSGVEPGVLEVPPHPCEGIAGCRREFNSTLLQQAVYIERPKPYALHVKSGNGARQRLAFCQESRPRVAGRMLLNDRDEFLDAALSGLAGICGSRHSRMENLPDFQPVING
jgi:hypothetical protein